MTDCYTPDGSTCNMPIDNNGLAEDCLTSLASPVLTIAHTFVDSTGAQVAKPGRKSTMMRTVMLSVMSLICPHTVQEEVPSV